MIEYYGINFIKHHKVFQKLSSVVFKDTQKQKIVDSKNIKDTDNVSILKALLETTLIKEAGTNFIPAY